MSAEKKPWKAFLDRAKNIMLHPGDEWQVIKEEEATHRSVFLGYAALIAAMPPLAAVLDRMIFGRNIAGNAVHSPLAYVFAANALWYCMIIVNLVITAAVITAVTGRNEPRWIGLRGLKLAVYSFTPSFAVCILLIIPGLKWLLFCAMAYSLYILYLGIKSMMEVGHGRAAWYTAASFLASGLIVAGLNLFEYFFESFIASKVFY